MLNPQVIQAGYTQDGGGGGSGGFSLSDVEHLSYCNIKRQIIRTFLPISIIPTI